MASNEKGVTLVEVLAALSLLSIILLMASSIHIFGLKQSSNQAVDIQGQSNVRLAMNIITKEIRKASSVELTNVDDADKNNDLLTINGTDKYKLENNSLTKNAQPIITNIQKFTLERIKDTVNSTTTQTKYLDNIFTISITNIPTNNIPQTTLSTRIYIRK